MIKVLLALLMIRETYFIIKPLGVTLTFAYYAMLC